MEFLSHPIVAAILLLGILIIVHEAGHYWVGKKVGIAVETFSIGFGPRLFVLRRGQTTYQLSAIPLGGYVRFYGATRQETVPKEVEGREFWRAAPWSRLATVAAGPMANIFLAMAAHSVLATAGIPYIDAVVGYVRPGGPAAKSGLVAGDRIVAIDGQKVDRWSDMEQVVSRSPDQQLSLEVINGEQLRRIQIRPQSEDGMLMGEKKSVGRIGIASVRSKSSIALLPGARLKLHSDLKIADEIIGYTHEPSQEGSDIRAVRNVKYFDELLRLLVHSITETDHAEVHLLVNNPIDESDSVWRRIDLEGMRSLRGQDSSGVSDSLVTDFQGWQSFLGLRDAQLMVLDPKNFGESLLRGDLIVGLDGHPVVNHFDLSEVLHGKQTFDASVEVIRGEEVISADVKLAGRTVDVPEGVETRYYFDLEFMDALIGPEIQYQSYSPLQAAVYGVEETINQSKMLLGVLAKLFTGSISVATMGGPILIAKVAGDAAKRGWQTFVQTLALISVNLAVVNLVPIPVLDGGQMFLIFSEMIKRRPISIKTIENYQRVGFVMIMALMVLVFYNDLNRFWSRMLEGLVGSG